jgi:tRNA A-37 threonylcarbamoyl transferase component Bud32
MFNLHAPGTRVETNIGDIAIINDISAGGEGQGYLADYKGRKVFYKQFHTAAVPPRNPEQTMALRKARTKFLVDSEIYKLDPLGRINAPFAYSKEGGYVCAWIENLLPLVGEPADGPSFLGQGRPYAQCIGVLLQIADLLALVHAKGISHGDLNNDNIGIVIEGGTVRVYLIDWSNFNCGDPALPPVMAGAEDSMAWWIRTKGEMPDQASDMQSLGIYGHELLLGRPVVQGCHSVAEMLSRLEKGDLAGDPLLGRHLAGNDTGLPFEILSPELQAQMRIMMRPSKEAMPSIGVFSQVMHGSLPNLITCPSCNSPLWWHASRHNCPKCSQPIGAALHLVVNGKTIPISGAMLLGRSELGGDGAVSTHHFRVHPMSPGRGHLTVMGLNGMKRQRGTERVMARSGQAMDIVAGDQLEIPTTSRPVLLAVL